MSRPLRVLLIEDNPDDAALLVRELQRAGYEPSWKRVERAPDLDAALDDEWELVLCDFGLPLIDPLAAVETVRQRQAQTPLIMVSGTIGEEHAVAALRSGARDFVLKDKLTRLAPAVARELRDSETRVKHARAESNLKATEASLRAAFELIPDGVLVCREGRVVHANLSAMALLGAALPKEVLGRPLFELFVASDQVMVRDRLRQASAAQASVTFGELTMQRRDGQRLSVEATAAEVLFDGELGVLVLARDVSARRELVARTMQVDRMLAVGTLAAGVGHEINNPLSCVIANVSFAREQVVRARRQLTGATGPAEGASRELSELASVLEEIHDAAHRIRDIARDLNTFARNEEELDVVDLRAAADSALRLAAPEVRQRARVVRKYGEVAAVKANASRISQVLLNLIINAAQAIEKGAYETNEIGVTIRAAGPKVIVEVSDTGCGMSTEHRDRLFTPFFTTKPAGQGTGLGLSISKRIVVSLGGSIEVETALGRGTTMRVLLPAFQERATRAPPAPPPRPAHGRILFVDDERLIGVAVQRALSRQHDVVVVESAAEALGLLLGGSSYDAIVCDINMPVMTGLEFYEELRRKLPDAASRVVMITGAGELRTREFAEAYQVPLLEKPLDLEQVRGLLARMVPVKMP